MPIQIERQDRKPEPCYQEIQEDWRVWARKEGYKYREMIAVPDTSCELELWEKPQTQESVLFQPPIPHTAPHEGVLHIIADPSYLAFTIETSIKVVRVAMMMVMYKRDKRKYRLN